MISDFSEHELLAQRDELIESIQGEWPIESDPKLTHRFALRSGALAAFVFWVLLGCIAAVTIMQNPNPHSTLRQTITTAMMVVTVISLGISVIIYGAIRLQALWYKRYFPMVVSGSELVWNKRKGHVPERLGLHALTAVIRYEGDGVDAGRVVFFLAKLLDPYRSKALSPCIFVAQGYHNTPRFSPSMIQNGQLLIETLEDIADLNQQLLGNKS
ncbi:MAG: hypothetical protein JJ974_03980 [Phycisphaerales bacterium]|nr:hypothetical protein [Phycisphaerales bacterium]